MSNGSGLSAWWRKRGEQLGIDAERGHLRGGAAQAFGHAFGGAAGGRGQRDARRRVAGPGGLRDAQHQQARDGGGLAGAGAAGDQQQRATQGECGGAGLAVAGARGGEQGCEQWCGWFDVAFDGPRCDASQLPRKATLVFAITAQVEQPIFEHKWRGFGFIAERCRHGDETRRRKLP